jgi:tight adherence protein C
MSELSWLGLLFLVCFWLSFTLLRRLLRPRQAPRDRWGEEENQEEAAPPLLGSMSEALAAQIPMTAKGKVNLQTSLRTAGFYKPTALLDYAAIRSLVILVMLVTTGVVALLVPPERVRIVVMCGLGLAVLGYSVPRFYLMMRGRRRCAQIERGLPFAIDLLALALSAGQNTLGALRRVSREIALSHPALAEELEIVQRQAALSSLAHALKQFSGRVPVAQVSNLALLLIQAERLGSDASAALLEFSTHHRAHLRQRAEGQANRVSFWMMFPSVCCLWVAATMLLVGPLYYEFWRQWAATSLAAQEAQTKIRTAGSNGQRFAPAAPKANPVAPPLNP